MQKTIPLKLQRLFNQIEHCKRCKKEHNHLRHIFGGGQFKNPKFFFLFINPTHKNLSSHPNYPGTRRYPFIGVRHLWKIFAEVGFIDKKTVETMYHNGWQLGDEERIENDLRTGGVYITNFVKCAQPNPINPPPAIMREVRPLVIEEIKAVNPKYIITFGMLPLKILANVDFRLRDILSSVRKETYCPLRLGVTRGKSYKILPCYFPLGHGNTPKAKLILKYIQTTF